ncbi:MAG: DEAD/DEAH box helicase family protein, partial [Aeromonas sp.]
MQQNILAAAISAVIGAKNSVQLLAALDAYTSPAKSANKDVSFGVRKVAGRSIDRERKEANAAAMTVLARVGDDASKLTDEDRAALRKYTGEGGIGGSQDEYYTPQYVAEGIWDAMESMGMGAGNYLEPSCGVGVFNGTKPSGMIITGAELSETSSRINQLLHPGDAIHTGSFEGLAVMTEDDTWDGAVGNVPFASNRAGLADKDPEYRDIKYVDQYFITRTIDKIRPGGLLCMVVPPRIISRAAWKKWRETLALKAEFLGAHRLPSSTFGENGTDTVTDVLVMRKHPEELAAMIADRKTADLKAANVIWDVWTSGKWFESGEGKRFIHGEQSVGTFQNRLEVKAGQISGADIKAKLAHKFESRIDWLSLELTEPQVRTWSEGDERLINGRWRRLMNGQWQEVSRTATDGNTIDRAVYGVDSLATLRRIVTDTTAITSLTYSQLEAAQRDFPSMFNGQIKQAMAMAATQEPKNRERVLRGTLIGINIQSLASKLASTGELPQEEAAILRKMVSEEAARYGVAAADRDLSALRDGPVASAWQSFVQSTDAAGGLSELLLGKIERGNTIAFDNTSVEQTVAYLYGVKDLNPVELSDFAQVYKGTVAPTLSDLAKLEGVAITPDGMLAPMDRATCGNVVESVAELRRAMATTSDQNLLDNFQRQLDAIEAKRQRNKIDDIEITMAAKWLPRRYISEYLQDRGFTHFGYGKVVQDEEGFQTLNQDYEGEDGIFWGYETREDLKKKSRSNSSFEVQLEHYLNGGVVSGGSLEGTAAHMQRIKAMEDDFGTWVRQHDDAETVIDKYNDTFHGYIAPDHSDADLGLTTIAGEISPFPYQNQAVRRLSEDGRGMLGFGTGLGKTTTAYLLAAYNLQMGRSKRTGIVVPKAVLENWYHEAVATYGRDYLDSCFFPGLDVVTNKDGDIETVPVLDDQGAPKLGKNGQPLHRDKLKLADKTTLVARMNQIPHTGKKIIVMTKEQFAELPLREETVVGHVDEMLMVGLRSGHLEREANTHRAAAKRANFKDKHSDTGTAKKSEYPYYEDCGFDSVIVDEAHNYRNTYEVNRQSAGLAHLPKPKSAKMAMDMQVKMSYLQRRNHGRGPVLLTATPTANSPCDIFNMLNHIIRPDEWAQYGIGDINDFIQTFGETAMVEVQKLTGEIEMRQGLVGFKNLSGLRSLFHRHCNLKSAQDVSDDVKVPDL